MPLKPVPRVRVNKLEPNATPEIVELVKPELGMVALIWLGAILIVVLEAAVN